MSPAKREMDGSKKIPRDVLSPTIAVLTIVMVVFAGLASLHQCSPTAGKRNLNDIEVKNVADERGQVVANLAGYVELLGDRAANLVLNVKEISNPHFASDHSQRAIKLYDDRIYLRIFYHINAEQNIYKFTTIEMFVKNDTVQGGLYEHICDFHEEFFFSLPADSRYSCQKVLAHPCSRYGKTVANLVLKSFEFELDGDQEQTAMREFSKPAWEDSCNHWKGIEQ